MSRKNNLKYHPDLVWTRPYVEAAWKHIPRGFKLTRINACYPQTSKCLGFYGQLSETETGHCLSLYTHYWWHISWFPKKRKIQPFSKIDLLQTLAHELAHCAHWEHTPDHKRLENKICNIFMRMLNAEGYESEEKELKEIKSQ